MHMQTVMHPTISAHWQQQHTVSTGFTLSSPSSSMVSKSRSMPAKMDGSRAVMVACAKDPGSLPLSGSQGGKGSCAAGMDDRGTSGAELAADAVAAMM